VTWIIAYDIACPRRWRRLYRLVKDHGARLQWSVFVATDPRFKPAAFLAQAARIVDPKADDVRLYRISGQVTKAAPSREAPPAPAGIHWNPLGRLAGPRRRKPALTTAP